MAKVRTKMVDAVERPIAAVRVDVSWNRLSGEKPYYDYCYSCARHPKFPDVPPITLHQGGKCSLCKTPDSGSRRSARD